ncbi:MAG: DUF488 domain-containing protein [Candidatus Babeliaceae bacterium]
MQTKPLIIFTIGHSTHPLDEFIEILKAYDIQEVIDIRTIPKSRHNPQFNEATLAHALRNKHIGYHHMKDLGGLRHTTKESINTAWENASFRGFANYMQTPKFAQALEKLIEYVHKKRVVIMCGEAVPWRCHRSLIGDALLVHHIKVEDIFSKTNAKPHTLTPWAVVQGTQVTYPKK